MAQNKGQILLVGGLAALGIGAMVMMGKKEPKKAPAFRPAAARKPTGPVAKKPLPPKDETTAVALATKYAGIFAIPVSLPLAIMANESGYRPRAYNPKAVSRGGAWGYGQMTLKTAQELTKKNPVIAKTHWSKWNKTGEGLFDPQTNIAMMCYYLSLLWKRYKTKPLNWLTTGTAYQQGPGNIDKQIVRGKGRVNPMNLPPNGKAYWTRLKNHLNSKLVLAVLPNDYKKHKLT